MRVYLKSRLNSFRNAFSGLWYVLRTQKNAWIHATATALVLLLASWLALPAGQWLILLLTISSVWVAEFINTAIEAVVDLASPHNHPLAKIAKDVGAAAVLIAAFFAALIGFLVLGPPLWLRIKSFPW